MGILGKFGEWIPGRKRVSPVPLNHVSDYQIACQAVLGKLKLNEMEREFLLSLEPCFENCLWRHNVSQSRDGTTERASQVAINRFWKPWDDRFEAVARVRQLNLKEMRKWQHDLYFLKLFSSINPFHGFMGFDRPESTYCHEAQLRDIRGRLERLIKSEKLEDVVLPKLGK